MFSRRTTPKNSYFSNAISRRLFARLIAFSTLLVASNYLSAGTYTWKGEGKNSRWSTGENWSGLTGIPAGSGVYDTDLIFTVSARNGSNLYNGYSARSITFDALVSDTITINMIRSNTVARNLRMIAGKGRHASIIVQKGVSGEITFTGGVPGGDVVLHNNLNVVHDGSGDLNFKTQIIQAEGARRGITKSGAGTLVLSAVNTYTGDTVLDEGTLKLAYGGSLHLWVGKAGMNTSVSGRAGNLKLNGNFVFDLTEASVVIGSEWRMLDSSNLNETIGSTFTVSSTASRFAKAGGVWTIQENGITYQFSEETGYLRVIPNAGESGYVDIPEPRAYALITGFLALSYLTMCRRRVR